MPSAHFEAQVERLVALEYPALLEMDPLEFRAALAPLADAVPDVPTSPTDPSDGKIPFVIVLTAALLPAAQMFARVTRRGKPAVERLYPKHPADFQTIPAVELPIGHAYLALDLERGRETLNITPDDAYPLIAAQGRSPLTLEEGIAVITQFPEFLQPNHCFSLLASRCGDKRVPAIWLSNGHPKLGWCWAGNPHTWLGSASCARRAGAVSFPAVATPP